MEDQELSNFIYTAYSIAYTFVQNQLQSNNFAISKSRNLRSVINHFIISEGKYPEIKNYRRIMHQIDRIYEKSGKGLELVTEQIKGTNDYSIIQKELNDFSKTIIAKLCEYLANQVLNQRPLTKSFVDSISRPTLKSISVGEITHISKFYVLGLFIKEESVGLYMGSDILRIKSPTATNFAEFADAFNDANSFNSIMEIETTSVDPQIDFSIYFHKYLPPILLHGIMHIDYVAQLTDSYFVTYHGQYSKGFKGADFPNHKFVIEDTIDFSYKVNLFYTKLVEQNVYNPSESESRAYSIHIALDRYKNALSIKKEQFDRKITEIIMGLEALYLTGQEMETLGFKLKYRITQVFVQLESNYEALLSIIGGAYSIRSSFAHGSAKSDKLKKLLSKLEEKHMDIIPYLLNMLRESLTIFLFLEMSKQDFIELINASFVDVSKREQLKELILLTRSKYTQDIKFSLNPNFK